MNLRKKTLKWIATFKGPCDDIVKTVLPMNEDLTREALLYWCLHGRMQNQNEAINQLYWIRCPKGVFAGNYVLELGVADAVIVFNSGMIETFDLALPYPRSLRTLYSHINGEPGFTKCAFDVISGQVITETANGRATICSLKF